jgi:hypothetical protein
MATTIDHTRLDAIYDRALAWAVDTFADRADTF